jgi:4-hydroxy-2-oxoheptanedioate aldolase
MGSLGTLRASIARGRATLGYLVTTPSPQIVQALARTGVDWLMIDTEHAPIGIESVAAMVAATGGTPVTPIVRVPAARPELVKPVLDCGALGIVFPQIATRQEAEATVQAVRYAPEGQRGYGPTYAALRWGVPNLEYLKAANEAVLNVLLIESQAGVDALDDILTVSGLDVVAVARGDLSQNLGVAGQFDHPHLIEVVAKAEAKIRAHGEVALGGIAFSPDDARAMIARGYRFIVLGSDAGLISGAAQRTVQAIRARNGRARCRPSRGWAPPAEARIDSPSNRGA